MKRIAVISPDFPPADFSGKSRMAVNYARYFAHASEYELAIISPTDQSLPIGGEEFENVIRVPVDERYKYDPLYLLFDAEAEKRLLKAINTVQPDIVFIHDLLNIPVRMLFLLREKKITTALCLHNLYPFCIKLHTFRYPPCVVGPCNGLHNERECICCYQDRYLNGMECSSEESSLLFDYLRLRNAYVMQAYRSVNMLISPSHFMAAIYEKKLQRSICVIHNGIELQKPREKRTSQKQIIFGYIGSFDRNKGIDTLFRAVSELPDLNLRIYSNVDELCDYSEWYSLFDRIEYRGGFNNEMIAHVFSEIDCLIVPSYFENYPTIVIEALSQRVPVIASRTGGVGELIQDGFNGLLFSAGNATELVELIQRLEREHLLLSSLRENITTQRSIQTMGDEFDSSLKKETNEFCGGEIDQLRIDIENELTDVSLQIMEIYQKEMHRGSRINMVSRLGYDYLKQQEAAAVGRAYTNILPQLQKISDFLFWCSILIEKACEKEADECVNHLLGKLSCIPDTFSEKKNQILYQLGSIFKKGDFYHRAMFFYDQVAHGSNDMKLVSGALYHQGTIALAHEEEVSAMTFFERCLKSNPHHAKAQEAYNIMKNNNQCVSRNDL